MTGLKNLWKLRHSTLTNNIVVLLMVFGITPLAILFLVFQYVFISHEKEGIESLQRENAVRLAENISWYVNQSLTPIKVLGEMLDGDFSNQNHFRELDEFLVQHPEYDQLTILDLQGREVCKLSQNYTYLPSELEDRRVDSSIQGALSGRSLIPPLELLPGSRTLSLRLLSPITDAQAHVIGVLEARMNLIPLWAMIGKSNIAGNGSAYLISPDGLLLAAQDSSWLQPNQDISTLPIVQAFAAGNTGAWDYRGLHGQPVIGASAVVPATGWGVIVEKDRKAAYSRVYRVVTIFLGLFAFTMTAAVLRGLIFSQNRIIGPVKAIQQELKSLSRGGESQGLTLTGNDELQQLSRAFNQMLQHLQKTTVSRDSLIQEVAERKEVEETLRNREATLNSIFLTVPLGIGSLYQWDLAGGNDFFYKMTGYSKGELRGSNLSQLFVQPSEYIKMVEQLRRTLSKDETARIETQWRRRDGQILDILLKFATIDKNDVEAELVFAAIDIGDMKKMEQERLKIDKVESLSILAGGIAHDFNNILTIILGNIELVGSGLKKQDKSLERLLEAEQACQRAQHLAKQLLTFTKGGAPIEKLIFVPELLQDVARLALSGSPSAVEFLIDENIWFIEIDKDQVYQVINNILINADQAMPNGGRITIKAINFPVTAASGLPLPDGKYVKFSFIDQGMGISPKDLDKIFDPYFSTKHSGNGLGLTTALSIVKNHRGYITVDSRVGEGTSFQLYLPAAHTVARPSDARISTMPVRGGGRILVMDDEASIRDVLGHMLDKIGYEAVCVRDGGQVLETYLLAKKNNELFDAVILDLTIPGGLGGKETLELLLKLDPKVQAIVSSGYNDDPIMVNYKKFGFKSVIAKPYKISELSLVLNDLLSKKKKPTKRIKGRQQAAAGSESH